MSCKEYKFGEEFERIRQKVDTAIEAKDVIVDNTENGLSSNNVQDALLEQVTKNKIDVGFTVKSGYTRMHPNLEIKDGIECTVEDGGELLIL